MENEFKSKFTIRKTDKGDLMLTVLLLLINAIATGLGIYMFDYKVDGMINNPLIIILSIIAGTIVMLVIFSLYIEGFYHSVAKRKPLNSKVKHFLAKQAMALPLHATNTRIKVIGRENLPQDPGFSIYSNHTSMMDIPVFMCGLRDYPTAFLAKQVTADLPVIGKWTIPLGCIMIDRSNDRKAAESIIKVIKNVKNGSTMVIFPEGTRTSTIGELIDFKPGSFKVALKSKAPLVPVTIVKPKNFKNIKWPFAKRVTLVIHKPLEYSEFRGMNSLDLCDKVKSIIESAL